MRLPPGATGFHTPGGRADVRAFTAVCHHAARALGATVTGVTPPASHPASTPSTSPLPGTTSRCCGTSPCRSLPSPAREPAATPP
ncbi:hypothetical protein V2I01_10790 [Micromonospora sp. BRA006-A]|nr:hypothetical protein [Micromonospora sp. BRA006-A]